MRLSFVIAQLISKPLGCLRCARLRVLRSPKTLRGAAAPHRLPLPLRFLFEPHLMEQTVPEGAATGCVP